MSAGAARRRPRLKSVASRAGAVRAKMTVIGAELVALRPFAGSLDRQERDFAVERRRRLTSHLVKLQFELNRLSRRQISR